MLTPRGKLRTPVAFHVDGIPLPLSLDSVGNLMVSLGDPGTPPASQPTPRGHLITPVGFYQDGLPLPLSLDANGYLMVNLNKTLREVLTADRTYYVRTDGSDSNDGSANDATHAFLTVQHAVNVVAILDINAYTVTIQLADGTYTEVVNLENVQGFAIAGNLVIKGNATTPANVIINATGDWWTAWCFSAQGIASIWTIKDMKLTSTGYGLLSYYGSVLHFTNINFGACMYQVLARSGASVIADGNYTISGNATNHWLAGQAGALWVQGCIITLTGTPAFSDAFAMAQMDGVLLLNGNTFSGTGTGRRFNVHLNGVIYTAGAGLTYLPGNLAGVIASGGMYDNYPAAVMTQTYSTADPTLGNLTSVNLTNNVSGSGTTVADPESSYTRATQRNNFYALADQYNKLRADHIDLAQFVNSLVDFLQILGVLQ